MRRWGLGATWLDRQAIAASRFLSDSGFGAEVRPGTGPGGRSIPIGEDVRGQQGERVVFARRLLNTLRRRARLQASRLGEKLAAETGMSFGAPPARICRAGSIAKALRARL